MLLAIDIGNTQTVVGVHSPRSSPEEVVSFVHRWRLSTHPVRTGDEFRCTLQWFLSEIQLKLSDVSAVILSSVVPQATAMVRGAFPNTLLKVIDHRWPFSFDILASPPEQVGADRLVNAEAALREYGAPVIIVDSGTATTLCAISQDRQYLGGAILPGISLAVDSLAKKTAQLFPVELTPPDTAIGGNTKDALLSGIVLGYGEMVDGLVKRFKNELYGEDIPVVGTGGVGHLLKGISKELQFVDPDLTLKGIGYLYYELQSK